MASARRAHIRIRENWYRDLWLLIVTGLLLVAVFRAQDLSAQAKANTVLIQQERRAVVGDTCRDQNRRHDATLHELHRQVAAQLARLHSAGLRQAASQGEARAELLIDALVPRKNCAAVVRAAVGP